MGISQVYFFTPSLVAYGFWEEHSTCTKFSLSSFELLNKYYGGKNVHQHGWDIFYSTELLSSNFNWIWLYIANQN